MTEMSWLDAFGDNLAEILFEQGVTQQELANRTGLSKTSISNYIRKVKLPGIRAIVNIAYALDVDVNELIDFGDMIG